MKKTHYYLVLALAMSAASCTKELLDAGQEPSDTVNTEFTAGEVYPGWVRIKLEESAEPLRVGVFTRGEAESGNPELDRIANMLGATEVKRVFADGGKFAERRRKYGLHLWYDVHFDESVPVTRATAEMTSIPGVAYAEPLPVIKLVYEDDMIFAQNMYAPMPVQTADASDEMPFNDPELNLQWHYHNDGSLGGAIAGADINLFEAWKIETGNPNVIVSIHDSGVMWTHEDLAANMWINEGELDGQSNTDNDGNGYRNDVYGYNFYSGMGAINPGDHGTHVAGTVAAVNNNGIGVCGVAGGDGTNPGVRLMSTQIQDNNLFCSNPAESYVYAADNGAVISQNSWCYTGINDLPASLAVAFDYFNENAGCDKNGNQIGPMKGGLIIFATGNDGIDTYWPAKSDKVIAVTSMNADFKRCTAANYGPDTDIIAPGGYTGTPLIYSTSTVGAATGGYIYHWGTSMACPHVSGVAALIVSHFGGQGFTAAECKERLLGSCRPMGGYVSARELDNIGVGLVDAAAALMDDPKSAPDQLGNPSVSVKLNVITIEYTVPADANGCAISNVKVEYTNKNGEKVSELLRNKYDVGKNTSVDLTVEYNASYDLMVYASDRWGNVSGGVALSATTGNFENKAPQLVNSLPSSSPKYGDVMTFILDEYFSDPNLADGDVLTYSVRFSGPNVVKLDLSDDNVLTVTAIAKGTATITVTATDIAGESVEGVFRVLVTDGPEPSADGDAGVGSFSVTVINPVEDTLTLTAADLAGKSVHVAIYDAASREVYSADPTLDEKSGSATLNNIDKLAPGLYILTVYAGSDKASASFIKK